MTSEMVIERLDESLLDAAIVCEITLAPETIFQQQCDNPAVARIRAACPCGRRRRLFICARCLDELRAGTILCSRCRSVPENWSII
jgi:hypothetical protein